MVNSWVATQPVRRASNASTASAATSVTATSNKSNKPNKPYKPKNAAAIAANWNVASKARNNAYTRKIAQWKGNVASGKINLTPYPTRKQTNAAVAEKYRKEIASLPAPVERKYGEPFKPEWMVQKKVNNSGNRAKAIQARMAAMVKPAGNMRHTMWKGKTRRTRRY